MYGKYIKYFITDPIILELSLFDGLPFGKINWSATIVAGYYKGCFLGLGSVEGNLFVYLAELGSQRGNGLQFTPCSHTGGKLVGGPLLFC